MTAKIFFRRGVLCLGFVFLLGPAIAATATGRHLPYRFLLVIQDQWKDPASEVVEAPTEFSMLGALLHSWGIPFDVYRLDQQRLDAYHLLDRDGQSRYSTIVWNAPDAALDADAARTLARLVQEQGVGLLALNRAVEAPAVAALLGLEAGGTYEPGAAPLAGAVHFITRGVTLTDRPDPSPAKLRRGEIADAVAKQADGTAVTVKDAVVLLARGAHPFATARTPAGAGRVVWLDAGQATTSFSRQSMRDLFKRALIWVNGYALMAEYPRSVILFMDDMGSSDKTYYSEWHYPTLSEALIRSSLIEPLRRHGAVMVQNVNTGFVDRAAHRIVNPWRQDHVVDELDPKIVHDFASTKRGLDAGVKAGVFDIQSHGWTHMAPDLDSPPGPLWSAPATGPVVQINWYKEFGDTAREREVPAIVQRLHMQRSLEGLAEDFGVRPVSLRCGGTQGSDSLPNNTMRIAAKLGFGIGQTDYIYYLGDEMCLPLNPISRVFALNSAAHLPAAEIPWTPDAPVWIGCHDRDVAMDAAFFGRLLDELGSGVRYLTCAEYCAYLHATVARSDTAPGGQGLALEVRYDDRYCDYFRSHPSHWTLYSADEVSGHAASPPERQTIQIPAGLGRHVIAVRSR